MNRFQSQRSKADKVDSDALKESSVAVEASLRRRKDSIGGYSSGDDYLSESKEKKLEVSWLPKALEPALQLCRWALAGPTGVFSMSLEVGFRWILCCLKVLVLVEIGLWEMVRLS